MKKRELSIAVLLITIHICFLACEKNDKTDEIVANFEFDCATCEAPSEVNFTNKSENANEYLWDFGNGQTSTENNPTTTYNTAGDYTLKLTASNGENAKIKSVVITINESSIEQNIYNENANNLITNQKIGDLQRNYLHFEEKIQSDNFYFFGTKNEKYIIGVISPEGDIQWEVELNYIVKNIKILGTDNLLVIGYTKNTPIRGVVSLYRDYGQFVSDLVYDNYEQVALHDCKIISNTDFCEYANEYNLSTIDCSNYANEDYNIFVVAGTAKTTEFYPYLSYFYIAENSKLHIGLPDFVTGSSEILFTDFPKARFFQIAKPICVDNNSGGGNFDFEENCYFSENLSHTETIYISSYTKNGSNDIIYHSVNKLSFEISKSYSVENCILAERQIGVNTNLIWENDIKAQSNLYKCFPASSTGNIFRTENYIYTIGSIETQDNKEEVNNGYHTAGHICCLSLEDGNFLWSKTVNLSKYSDHFLGFYGDCNNLYLCGKYASYYKSNSYNSFGYGWISKLNIQTGDLIDNKFIGNSQYYSCLNTIHLNDEKIYSGGLTEPKQYNANDYKSWFVEIDN